MVVIEITWKTHCQAVATCTHLDIGSERTRNPEKIVKCGKFYVTVDREIFRYLKNKK